MAKHNDLGRWGEEMAAHFLRTRGYIIREVDWKAGHRDIDIIALTPDNITCVFVEVKTRSSKELVLPQEAVDFKKIRLLGSAANEYVKLHDITQELRFDIISIVGTNEENMQIQHIEDAFNPLLL